MKVMRKIVEIDELLCNGCGECIIDCHESAIEIVNGKAKIISENLCDGLGDCLKSCPQKAITIKEKLAESYSEEKVKSHLQRKFLNTKNIKSVVNKPSQKNNINYLKGSGNWPIKLKLINPNAQFFQSESLIISADCSAFHYARFKDLFDSNTPVLIGCPKFEDTDMIKDKVKNILLSNKNINKITIVRMEVPCCSGLIKCLIPIIDELKLNIDMQYLVINI